MTLESRCLLTLPTAHYLGGEYKTCASLFKEWYSVLKLMRQITKMPRAIRELVWCDYVYGELPRCYMRFYQHHRKARTASALLNNEVAFFRHYGPRWLYSDQKFVDAVLCAAASYDVLANCELTVYGLATALRAKRDAKIIRLFLERGVDPDRLLDYGYLAELDQCPAYNCRHLARLYYCS